MQDLPPLSVDQLRRVDQGAARDLGLPTLVLMENAAVNAAAVLLDLLAEAVELDRDQFRVAIVCGPGNNGGDGFALARHLSSFDVDTIVYTTRPIDTLTGDAAVMAGVWQRLGGLIEPLATDADRGLAAEVWPACHVLVDAVMGTGASGRLREPEASAVRLINTIKPPAVDVPAPATHEGVYLPPTLQPQVLSLDLPSGLDADTGEAAEPTVVADVTVTFAASKQGFAAAQRAGGLGRVVLAGIGLPDPVVARLAGLTST